MPKPSPRLFWLLLWLTGILFPAAWLGRFSATYQRAFDSVFSPPWIHVVMHALLYAVLVMLLARVFHLPSCPRTALLLSAAVLAAGVIQEGLQALNQGFLSLDGALFDLLIDLVGGAAGYSLLSLPFRRSTLSG